MKAKGFDFSKLSLDNNGYVYALNIFYAGTCDNKWCEGLWPGSGSLDRADNVGGGRKFMDFQITNIGDYPTLGTYCHENGHMLCSFPDLYDYGNDGFKSKGAGLYCLMASGNAAEKNPIQVCAYLKYKAGWADNASQLQSGAHTVNAELNEFYIYKNPLNPVEYFIIENRFRQERDSSLPDSGLAIWHVDELGSNEYQDMTLGKHYECALEQADGHFDLERGSNRGNAGDLFSAASNSRFDSLTVPNSKWWDGTFSKLTLTNISKASTLMSFEYIDH